MKTAKVTVAAMILVASASASFAMGCNYSKHESAMSCAEGMVLDTEKGVCVPVASS